MEKPKIAVDTKTKNSKILSAKTEKTDFKNDQNWKTEKPITPLTSFRNVSLAQREV